MKNYHCCATCEHFQVLKKGNGTVYRCSRLGYDTRPNYRFNCWDPKDHVKKRMAKNN